MADRLPPGHRRSTYRRSLRPRQSTSALTAKLLGFAVIATVAIGLLIATQMASGSDPALGPKAVAQKKKAAKSRSGDSSAATGSGSGADPYGQVYGGDGSYYYGNGSSGYSGSSGNSGSSGYSSGSGGSSYSAPPVTSSTS